MRGGFGEADVRASLVRPVALAMAALPVRTLPSERCFVARTGWNTVPTPDLPVA